jgi:hypothetical protein
MAMQVGTDQWGAAAGIPGGCSKRL